MNSLVLRHCWRPKMNDRTTSILIGLQQQIVNWRTDTYLEEKYRFRTAMAIPRLPTPRWTDTTPTLVAQVYDAHKSSLLHASHIIKRIWDMHRPRKIRPHSRRVKRRRHLPTVQKNSFPTTLLRGVPRNPIQVTQS